MIILNWNEVGGPNQPQLSEEIGLLEKGTGDGMKVLRPWVLFLYSLASYSAMDVITMLKKTRHKIDGFQKTLFVQEKK